jgi:hypothetical protein
LPIDFLYSIIRTDFFGGYTCCGPRDVVDHHVGHIWSAKYLYDVATQVEETLCELGFLVAALLTGLAVVVQVKVITRNRVPLRGERIFALWAKRWDWRARGPAVSYKGPSIDACSPYVGCSAPHRECPVDIADRVVRRNEVHGVVRFYADAN